MADASTISETRILFDGFGMGESPRWHDGRLWFSSWGTDEVIAVDLDGTAEVVGPGGGGPGLAVDWLPDGRMLVTGAELIRVEPDGSRVRHADLRHISPYGWSELTVDGRGNVYVNSLNFDFARFRRRPRERPGAGQDRAGHARRSGPRGRRWPGVPERHGRDAGQRRR